MDHRTFQNEIYQQYQELFDLAQKLESAAQGLLEEFNAREIKLFDLPAYKRIFLFILTRALKTYSSILVLCHNGYGQDPAVLLRSLLENLITAKYILHDERSANDKAQRFVAYKWIIFKRHLSEQENNLRQTGSPAQEKEFKNKKEMILEKVEEFKKKFKISSDRALLTWSGKTVRDMAQAVDKKLLEDYETTFRLCSRFSHPSVLGDKEYLIQDDQHLIFSPLPSAIGVVSTLKSAIQYTLEFLFVINQIFQFNNETQLNNLRAEADLTFQMNKYQKDETLNGKSRRESLDIRQSKIAFKTKLSS